MCPLVALAVIATLSPPAVATIEVVEAHEGHLDVQYVDWNACGPVASQGAPCDEDTRAMAQGVSYHVYQRPADANYVVFRTDPATPGDGVSHGGLCFIDRHGFELECWSQGWTQAGDIPNGAVEIMVYLDTGANVDYQLALAYRS